MIRICLLLLGLAASGCVSTAPVSLASPDGRTEVNARSERSPSTLYLVGQGRRVIRDLHVGPEATTWTDRITGEACSAATSDVVAVTFRPERRVILKWAAVGVAVGAVLGGIASTQDQGGIISFTPLAYTAIFGLGGGQIAAGASALPVYRYVYEPRRPNEIEVVSSVRCRLSAQSTFPSRDIVRTELVRVP